MVLLLITTVPSMILAHRGVPPPWLLLATLLGGTAAAGGSNAINQFLDRDIDDLMGRTRGRPVPSGRIAPGRALAFGIGLAAAAMVWLAALVNALSAILASGAAAFYVIVYTLWLKRRSSLNIVIGGAAGGAPVLVGWAAVTGRVAAPAVLLFAIVFLWTPPHFWALAIRYRRDYARAGIPMLPSVATVATTSGRIVGYTLATVGASLALYPVGHMGVLYLASAILLGGWFVAGALRVRGDPRPEAAMVLFLASIRYLALLFLAIAADVVVRFGP